jgi:guanylate kinase
MEADIKEGKFLEFGEFNGNIYGTKLESIHYTVQQGKMCVLDVNPTVSFDWNKYWMLTLQ